ncbi:transporter [Natronorubrum daqingense]|uniref:Transporter n=1 Tax=Natronorubrum daqingense TaxID=588898 RepID=A0A1N7E5T3_9EURY|nr:transporter [Natronorubrum daqingense]APX96376.1 transporter [Natronorubrum daqingense]SIR83404.1 hypothetical protein SAMN05421809_2476 [Natronorubrum daqingense]
MVRLSTLVILAGIVLVIVPIPPIGITLGPILILVGLALRLVAGV